MPVEFPGKLVLTPHGIEFHCTGGIQPYDAEALMYQFTKCDVYVELQTYKLPGVQPRLVFPFVRRVQE